MKINLTPTPVQELWQEGLALGLFSDERPPRGYTGTVDWRLNGMISRSMVSGHITGEEGETVLLAPDRRAFPSLKVLIVGLGSVEDVAPHTLYQAGTTIVNSFTAAGCSEFAASVPGAGREELSTADLAESLIAGMLNALGASGRPPEQWPSIYIVESDHLLRDVERGVRSAIDGFQHRDDTSSAH
ncbi:MAG: hypothetical protein AVO39_03465 [delta proteobacterium MLS_D]|jgi:hypothetical protein|nr:MAG: hypothetical protein AVO39_03465 [delta proteobacterium MLS_D]